MHTVHSKKSRNIENNEALTKLEKMLDESYKNTTVPVYETEIDNLHYMNARLLALIEKLIRRLQ